MGVCVRGSLSSTHVWEITGRQWWWWWDTQGEGLIVMMRLTDVGGETWSVSFPFASALMLWCLVGSWLAGFVAQQQQSISISLVLYYILGGW